MSQTGQFVWRDCMTTDPEQAEKFYTSLFGWQVNEVDMGSMGKYRLITAGGCGIGGFVKLEESAGVPSHWIPYACVDDVDAACARAAANGGQTCVPPTDIPEVGRFAVVTDPSGAVFSPFAYGGEEQPQGPPEAGRFCWEELLTDDVDRAKAFYGEVIGWRVKEWPMGDQVYTLFAAGETDVGGAMKMPPEAEARPHWLSYVMVDDVDASASRAEELGATVPCAPSDIPQVGRFAVLQDPAGAAFAVYKSAQAPS